jgi:hypothetical protein
MARNGSDESAVTSIDNRLIFIIAAASSIVYFFSNPSPQKHYDYTFRVAENLLRGGIGFAEKQPTWLNEFVPFEGFYYSVFPLGAVLSMLPFAFLKVIGLVTEMPSAFLAALCAGLCALFLMLIARRYEISRTRIILMSLGVLFGTWTWTNVTMGGAWQLALGFCLGGRTRSDLFHGLQPKTFACGCLLCIGLWKPDRNSSDRSDILVFTLAQVRTARGIGRVHCDGKPTRYYGWF